MTDRSNGKDLSKWQGRIEVRQEVMIESVNEVKLLLKEHLSMCHSTVTGFDKRIDKIDNEITAIKVKSTIYGSIMGTIMGFIAGMLRGRL